MEKRMSNPLDTKMFGRTLAEWAVMTPEERSADSRIRSQANKLKTLQEAIDAADAKNKAELAAAMASTTPAAPAPSPETTPAPADDASAAFQHGDALLNKAADNLGLADEDLKDAPAAETDDQSEPVGPVTIETVFRELATRPPAVKVRTRILECRLTPAQAEIHAKLQAILQQQGVHARRAGDVYGWLLDQVAKSVAGE
jgi:hypothetical protein